MFGMSSERPKSKKPDVKTSAEDIPEEFDLGFASGVLEDEDEGREGRVWHKEDVIALAELHAEYAGLQQPMERNAYQVPMGDFIYKHFPGLTNDEFPARARELSETIRDVGSGRIPRGRNYTPRLMEEYFKMAIKALSLNF